MSLRDLCDVAYVIQVEVIERRAVALSAIGKDTVFLPEEMRAEFDAYLVSVPEPARVLSSRHRGMLSLIKEA